MLSTMLRFLGGAAGRHPIYAHYGVTHRCNLRCRMCAIWRSAAPSKELSTAEVGELAQFLKDWGVISVSLGGGEPLLRPDITDVVRAFTSRGLRTRLLTNGVTGTGELMEEVVNCGLREVSISLDSLVPERQEWVYSRSDALAEITQRLAIWRRLLKGGILLLNCVVSRLNLDELPRIAWFARKSGYFVSYVPVHIAGPGRESGEVAADAPEFEIPPDRHGELVATYRKLIGLKRRGFPIVNSTEFLIKSCEYLRTGRAEWRCEAGTLYVSVGPAGLVSPCHRVAEAGGVHFAELAARRDEFRRHARRWARECWGCMRPCWAEVSFLAKPRGMIEFAANLARRPSGT